MYNDPFYDMVRREATSAASLVLPRMFDLFPHIESVIDVGCGEGAWLNIAKQHQKSVFGIDGDHVKRERLLIENDEFESFNLEMPLSLNNRWDLVISLEVAEHLSPGRAIGFIESLCSFGDIVLFSAAVPHQGGVNHLNERRLNYWIKLFDNHGYKPSGIIRYYFWNDDRIMHYYRQNMMLFVKNLYLDKLISEPGHDFILDVVHPDLYDEKMTR